MVTASTVLAKLEDRRRRECRLTPDRALASLEDAAAFLAERGMLTRMPDCSLPSLFGACHEEPLRAGGRGFDLWPKTRWMWSFQLATQPGVVLTKLHRGKSLYLTRETARLFDPLVREAIASAAGDERLLLDYLASSGPSMSADAELELGWDRRRVKRARDRLERLGAVVSEGLVFDDISTWRFAPLLRWDQVFPGPAPIGEALAGLIEAGMRAAVLAPEADLRTWYPWPPPKEIVDRLVEAGRLERPAPGWLAYSGGGGLPTSF